MHASRGARKKGACIAQDLDAALKAEDYGAAAELRDAGCAGLMGWWVSRAEGDPGGHLLRVAPSYARYTCQMYTPRDFADLKVGACLVGLTGIFARVLA